MPFCTEALNWCDRAGSMSQAAGGLGKLAVQVGVPLEMLWERIPGWTDTDVERAKELVESGELEKLLAELVEETTPKTEKTQQESTSGDAE